MLGAEYVERLGAADLDARVNPEHDGEMEPSV